jgi:hypothetical protein
VTGGCLRGIDFAPEFSNVDGNMKSSGPLKHFVIPFIIALVLYAVAYTYIENRRTRQGPWEMSFKSDNSGAPTLEINEPKLNLAHVQISFPNEKSAATTTNVNLNFREPKQVPFAVPFGTCIFMDTTFQPGTVVFNLFGHEVQLIPRVLTIDRKEYEWKSGGTYVVTNAPILTNAVGVMPSAK